MIQLAGRGWRIVAVAVLLVSLPAAARTVRFSGDVRHGEWLRRPMAKGLWFCLTPVADTGRNSGWSIRIQPTCERAAPDYASIATPPYYGPNPVQITAWFFDEGANAPQGIHDFQFVLTLRDHDRLKDAADKLPAGTVLELIDKLGRGHGHLVITGRRMNPRDGSINWIRFTVRLEWPDGP